jgi:hypothetical protein
VIREKKEFKNIVQKEEKKTVHGAAANIDLAQCRAS